MPPVAAFFGAVGTAVGIGAAGSAVSVVAGGVIVGAVAGAAVAAATGGNIWKGALIGGVIGGTLGWGMTAAPGAFGTTGMFGPEGTIAAGAAEEAAAAAATKAAAIEAGTYVAPTAGLTSGESLAASAALQGVSGAYSKKMELEALTEQERMKIDQDNRLLAAQRATPGGADILAPKVTNTPWANNVQAAGSLALPGTIKAPTVSATGAQQVAPGSVSAGFNSNLFAPKLA